MNPRAAALAGALVSSSAYGSKGKPRPNFTEPTAALKKSRRKIAKRSRVAGR